MVYFTLFIFVFCVLSGYGGHSTLIFTNVKRNHKPYSRMTISTTTTTVERKWNAQFQIDYKNVQMPFWVDLPGHLNPACREGTKLLILIMTRRGAFQNRNGIRQTWLKDAVNGTVARFLVANSTSALLSMTNPKELSNALGQLKQLKQEQAQYKDLVFLDGIEEGYAYLHMKWLAGLLWQQAFCQDAKWLLKTDDDTAVDLPRLDHWIENKFSAELRKNAATYFGWLISGVGPYRDPGHKWYISKEAYPEDKYPDYLQGATYLASSEAIRAVLKRTHEVDGFNMDDVLFTGILADRANVSRSDQRQIFRVGHQLRENEDCEKGWPYATAVYGGTFHEMYEKLESIEC